MAVSRDFFSFDRIVKYQNNDHSFISDLPITPGTRPGSAVKRLFHSAIRSSTFLSHLFEFEPPLVLAESCFTTRVNRFRTEVAVVLDFDGDEIKSDFISLELLVVVLFAFLTRFDEPRRFSLLFVKLNKGCRGNVKDLFKLDEKLDEGAVKD